MATNRASRWLNRIFSKPLRSESNHARRRARLKLEALEDRLAPATFALNGSNLALSGFLDGESIAVTKTGIDQISIVLGADTWSGVDDDPMGVTGNGSATLFIDSSVFVGGIDLDYWSGNFEADLTLTFHGGGANGAFANSFGTSFQAAGADIAFANGPIAFDGSLMLSTHGDIKVDAAFTAQEVYLHAHVITVNADIRTWDAAGKSGDIFLSTPSFTPGANILLNALVQTGDATDSSEVPPESGRVSVSAGTDLIGNADGRLRTGDASGASGLQVQSGEISISAGEVRLAADNDALRTGSATATDFTPRVYSGTMSILATKISADGLNAPVAIHVGAAIGPDLLPQFVNPGLFQFITNGGEGADGGVFVTSDATLYLGSLFTQFDSTQTIHISTTSGDIILNTDHSGPFAQNDDVVFNAFGNFRLGDFDHANEVKLSQRSIQITVGGTILDSNLDPEDESTSGLFTTEGDLVLSGNMGTELNRLNVGVAGKLVLNVADSAYITTGDALELGAVTSGAGNQLIDIATRSAGLTVLNATEIIAGDTLIYDAGNSTITVQDTSFNIGDGSWTLRAAEIDFTGGASSIQGSGTLEIQAIDDAVLGSAAPSGALDLTPTDLAAMASGLSVIISANDIDVSGSATVSSTLILQANGSVSVADGATLKAAALSVTATASITTAGSGLLETTAGDMSLHTITAAIGGFGNPVNVLVVGGQLSLTTEAPGGADGDVFITSPAPLTLGSLITGPDPDVVQIGTTSGGLTVANSASINDHVAFTSAGTVNLAIDNGNFETASLNVNAAQTISGTGGLKSTDIAGIVLISTSGGIGGSGAPIVLIVGGDGKLIATTASDQFLSTIGTVNLDTLDAGGNTITLHDGVFTLTSDNSIANTSSVAILTDGTLDLDTFNEIIQQLILNGGTIVTSSGTIEAVAGTILISGEISGLSGSATITKQEDGTVILSGDNNAFTGTMIVPAGTVALATDFQGESTTILVEDSGILAGGGETPMAYIGVANIDMGGTGSSGNSPGILIVGTLTLNTGSNYRVEIFGPDPGTGHDQFIVTNSITINNANLLIDFGSFEPLIGEEFIILKNDTLDPISGQFAGLPEGALVATPGGKTVIITYEGGDGNDVSLLVVNDAPPSFDSVPISEATVGIEYTYNISVSDPDLADALTITAVAKPDWLTFQVTGDSTATLIGTPTNNDIGPNQVVLEVSDGLINVRQSFTITVVSALSISTASLPGDVFNTAYSQTIVVDGTAPFSFTVSAGALPSGLTLDETTGQISGILTAAGSFQFTISVMDENDAAAEQEYTVHIAKADQEISYPGPLADSTYGDAPFAVHALADSGLAVTFSIFSGPATIDGNLITITGAGTVVVRASQAGDDNYNAADHVDESFQVAKAILTVTADDLSRPVGQENPEFTFTITGFVNDETLETSGVTGGPKFSTLADEDSLPGQYDIHLIPGFMNAVNYDFEYVDGTLTINAVADLTGTKFALTDFDGDKITITLGGGGEARVIVGSNAIAQIILTNTTANSVLTVKVKKAGGGNGMVDIGSITGAGALKSITASTSNLTGDGIELAGHLAGLRIRNVLDGASILAGGSPALKTTFVANMIGASQIDFGSSITSFTAAAVGDGSITASTIGKLAVKGDFDADLSLTGNPSNLLSLKSASIGGGISDAVWSIVGNAGSLVVKGLVEDWDLDITGTLAKATLGRTEAAKIAVNGSVSSFTAATFIDSYLLAGFDPDFANPMLGGQFTSAATIKKFTVKGIKDSSAPAYAGSTVAASVIGAVSLPSVEMQPDADMFGVLAEMSIGSVKVKSPVFVYNKSLATPQGIAGSSFRVIIT